VRLADKVALITGAGSGIGRQIARRFAAEGAHVVIVDIDLHSATEAVSEIANIGGTAFAFQLDVTDENQVDETVGRIVAQHGGIDVLVNNAGVQHLDRIADVSFENWKRVLAVHLNGGFLMTRACLKGMYSRGRGGSVIFMGSVHSKEASEMKGPYVVAKHGLLGLCRVVAKEGAKHGVRANAICPGWVRTSLVNRQIPALSSELGLSPEAVVREVMLRSTVDGVFTTEDDVAETALFFATFPTNALTGQSVVVSHGWHMS
jgi:3-hydroxybutyrate dehydrogenase